MWAKIHAFCVHQNVFPVASRFTCIWKNNLAGNRPVFPGNYPGEMAAVIFWVCFSKSRDRFRSMTTAAFGWELKQREQNCDNNDSTRLSHSFVNAEWWVVQETLFSDFLSVKTTCEILRQGVKLYRSRLRILGRLFVWYMESCWRRARFSKTRSECSFNGLKIRENMLKM